MSFFGIHRVFPFRWNGPVPLAQLYHRTALNGKEWDASYASRLGN